MKKNLLKGLSIFLISMLIFTNVSSSYNKKNEVNAAEATLAATIGSYITTYVLPAVISTASIAATNYGISALSDWVTGSKDYYNDSEDNLGGGGSSRDGDYSVITPTATNVATIPTTDDGTIAPTSTSNTSYTTYDSSGADTDYIYTSYNDYDNRSYTIVKDSYNSTTNEYTNYVYSPTTNTYETINNIYYSYDYDTYYFETNNYNYYVTNNYNYISYYVESDYGTTEYYEIYYELPDGRNSYFLEREDVWGEYFVYDCINYDLVEEDDGVTIGLWHFDGDGTDASANGTGDFTGGNGVYTDGKFGYAYKTSTVSDMYSFATFDDTSISLSASIPSNWYDGEYTVEFYLIVPNSYETGLYYSADTDITLYTDYYYYPFKYEDPINGGNYGFNLTQGVYHIACVYADDTLKFYVNGVYYSSSSSLIDVLSFSGNKATTFNNADGFYFSPNSSSLCIMQGTSYYSNTTTYTGSAYLYGNGVVFDELRISSEAIYTSNFVAPEQPFDTNMVLVLPEVNDNYTIAVMGSVDISDFRVGGVRPTYPTNGYVYVYLENDIIYDIQQYQDNGWYSVGGSMCLDGEWVTAVGQDLSAITFSDDDDDSVDGESGSTEGETDSTEGETGSTEGETDSTGDETGSTEGETDDSDGGIFEDLFDFSIDFSGLLSAISSLLSLITGLLTIIIDSISELIASIVGLFDEFIGLSSSFGDFLAYTFQFIPDEYWSILILGATLSIIAAIIKIFMG